MVHFVSFLEFQPVISAVFVLIIVKDITGIDYSYCAVVLFGFPLFRQLRPASSTHGREGRSTVVAKSRHGIFKLLRILVIDYKDSIPPARVAWWAGSRFLAPLD